MPGYYFISINEIRKHYDYITLTRYNEKNGDLIPNHIKGIYFQYSNETVNRLPLSLIDIMFYPSFDNFIDNLPLNSNILKLETDYVNINNLPSKITVIKINMKFNKNIDNLPITLLSLRLWSNFNKKIDKLPYNITTLDLGSKFDKKIDKIPPSVLNLYVRGNKIDYFPNTIKNITFGKRYTGNLDNLPESIEKLILHDYPKNVNDLPSSVKEIWVFEDKEHLINKIYHHKIKFIDEDELEYERWMM